MLRILLCVLPFYVCYVHSSWQHEPPPINLRMAVFVDYALFLKFYRHANYNSTEARSLAIGYAEYMVKRTSQMFKVDGFSNLINVQHTFLKIIERADILPIRSRTAQITDYMVQFCAYQQNVLKRGKRNAQWNHATLLTGYDLHHEEESDFTGFAHPSSLCSTRSVSCSVVEAHKSRSFFTLAHELGHVLGLSHDGTNGCDDDSGCIMSPHVTTSMRAKWSSCSQDELRAFAEKLRQEEKHDCLMQSNVYQTPAIVTADDQCRQIFGQCFASLLSSNSLCGNLLCSNRSAVFSAGVPQHKTPCGRNRWCISGVCSPRSATVHSPLPVIATWSSWTSPSHDNTCGNPGCSPCVVSSQIPIYRQFRYCIAPEPLPRGLRCLGRSLRVMSCSQHCDRNSLPDISEYIEDKCAEYKAIPRGYLAGACNVQCLSGYSPFVYTFSVSLPDGLVCGLNRACVSGRCRTVQCELTKGVVGLCGVTELMPLWASWSSWSSCSATCGRSVSRRQRRCISGMSCPGRSYDIRTCVMHCDKT